MSTGPTGLMPYGQMGATGATGPTGPTFVMTMEQLLKTSQNALQLEAADKAKFSVLLNPNTAALTPAFLQWTSQGFPPMFVLTSISLSPTTVCSDGVTRHIYDYITFLLGADLSSQVQLFATNFSGMEMSYSVSGTMVNIHVSKL